jgi:hypothetical protein
MTESQIETNTQIHHQSILLQGSYLYEECEEHCSLK